MPRSKVSRCVARTKSARVTVMGNVRAGRVALTYAVYATPAALGDPGDCDYCVRRTGIIRRTIANPLPTLFAAIADYGTGTESTDGSCFVDQAVRRASHGRMASRTSAASRRESPPQAR